MDSLHTSPSRVSYSAFVIILEKNGRDIVQVQFIDASHQN